MASPAASLARPFHLLAVLAAVAALGGCSTIGFANAVEPKAGLTITRGVDFEPGAADLRLDVYSPRPGAQPAPIVVFFYGGSWDSGRRKDYGFVGKALASRGYVAVVPDYRLYPQVRWPTFLQDGAEAVRWARDHGREFGGDPARIVVMGHSAGAYNAAMLALDGRWLEAVGLDPARDLKGMVGLAGPYDFLPLDSDELKAIFGPLGQQPDTQPINHVTGHAPPPVAGDRQGRQGGRPRQHNPAGRGRPGQGRRGGGALLRRRQPLPDGGDDRRAGAVPGPRAEGPQRLHRRQRAAGGRSVTRLAACARRNRRLDRRGRFAKLVDVGRDVSPPPAAWDRRRP